MMCMNDTRTDFVVAVLAPSEVWPVAVYLGANREPENNTCANETSKGFNISAKNSCTIPAAFQHHRVRARLRQTPRQIIVARLQYCKLHNQRSSR
jgi:hypothetical protein